MAVPPPVIDLTATQKPAHTSSHRLATQSASDALQDLDNAPSAGISSGLRTLDRGLIWDPSTSSGGFERGKVAEIWGPSGSGKTALALNVATQAIKTNAQAVWIDCATLLSGSRLQRGFDEDSSGQSLMHFHYLSVSTLSHLLAIILHPPQWFPPSETAVLIIDDINMLVDLDYPRYPFNSNNRSEQQKWQATRRYAVLGSLVTALNKFAVLHNMAIIVTTGCGSRMRRNDGLPMSIAPGIGGSEWEAGIWSRIVAFRDFSGRFFGVQKCQGRNITPLDPVGDVRNAIGFEVTADGRLKEYVIDLTSSGSSQVAVPPVKPASSPIKIVRKRTYDEVADSEDEDDEFGWADADDVTAAEGLRDEQKAAKLDPEAT